MKKLLLFALVSALCSAQTLSSLVSATGYGMASPGSAATLYGNFLGVPTVAAPAALLPPVLGGIQVIVNGRAASLYYVSASQINLQIPWEITTPTVTVSVTGFSGTATFPIAPAFPSIFETDPVTHQAAVLDVSYELVSYAHPVPPGSVIQIFLIGLGPVTVSQVDGNPAAVNPLAYTTLTPQVAIGGTPATVLYSGLAPGISGLYQINAIVPNKFGNDGIALELSFFWVSYPLR